MALLRFENIGLRAVSATVPHRVVKTRSLTEYYSEEEIEKFISATGVEERRFIDKDKSASDLCYKSACQIFDETDINRKDIDALFYISQTPDYKIPGSSIILQDKLGLSKSTIVYDINMSCSGFIHGLLMAYNFLQHADINNVMVMVGETLSKMISLQDKSTGKLLGDAGTVAVISKGVQYGESFFSICTEGDNINSVIIKGGGAKIPSSPETLKMQKWGDGSIRNLEQIIIVGDDVFSFAISVLPRDIKNLLEFAGKSIDEIDKYAFHQANNYMTNYIVKKAKGNPDKLLQSIQKYGNTAGTSIPLCLVENRDKINTNDSILMNAIGAGFAYGTALLNIADCKILKLQEL
ncbi:MAG: ketoacyl-ACP synthase III [Dysgonamonadaceae bacterium]|nr:ketoacyl-ACP synthase III [Dysgonamonadaceae bacterium]